jgi:hypothetical protein
MTSQLGRLESAEVISLVAFNANLMRIDATARKIETRDMYSTSPGEKLALTAMFGDASESAVAFLARNLAPPDEPFLQELRDAEADVMKWRAANPDKVAQ